MSVRGSLSIHYPIKCCCWFPVIKVCDPFQNGLFHKVKELTWLHPLFGIFLPPGQKE